MNCWSTRIFATSQSPLGFTEDWRACEAVELKKIPFYCCCTNRQELLVWVALCSGMKLTSLVTVAEKMIFPFFISLPLLCCKHDDLCRWNLMIFPFLCLCLSCAVNMILCCWSKPNFPEGIYQNAVFVLQQLVASPLIHQLRGEISTHVVNTDKKLKMSNSKYKESNWETGEKEGCRGFNRWSNPFKCFLGMGL